MTNKVVLTRDEYVELMMGYYRSWGAILPRLHISEIKKLLETRTGETRTTILKHLEARQAHNKQVYADRKARESRIVPSEKFTPGWKARDEII